MAGRVEVELLAMLELGSPMWKELVQGRRKLDVRGIYVRQYGGKVARSIKSGSPMWMDANVHFSS